MQLGNYNLLEAVAFTKDGLIFSDGENRVLLPGKYLKNDIKIGQKKELFVYKNSDGKWLATTRTPKAVLHDFKALRVKETTKYGAFLDWGLEKDLFVPFSEQLHRLRKGEIVVAYIKLDEQTERLIATVKVRKYLKDGRHQLEEKEQVQILVYAESDVGYSVVINNRFDGLVHLDDAFAELEIGQELTGYIKKVRHDGKVDVTLQRSGIKGMDDARDQLLSKLEEWDGFIPYTDKTSPETIREKMNMSKKAFKRAIGNLLKMKFITLDEKGITLKKGKINKIKGNG